MTEKHYVFLVANRVENIAVFAEQDDELAIRICQEQGYDKFIWLSESDVPAKWSTHDNKTNEFTLPTDEYLISIGVLEPIAPTPNYAVWIKSHAVVGITEFEEGIDDITAAEIARTEGYDKYVWLNDRPIPALDSTYSSVTDTFTAPN